VSGNVSHYAIVGFIVTSFVFLHHGIFHLAVVAIQSIHATVA
jgi:hypothetical protein